MSNHGRPASIELEGVSKTYSMGAASVHAIKNVNLCIRAGEYVAILGPSGSGKSTLMHILGCLDTPTEGTYRLDGVPVGAVGPNERAEIRNRRVGFVFQSFHLLPNATAVENVETPMVFAGVPPRTRRRRAAELLARIGLEHRRQHVPAELSGGECQRVAIARALANNPSVILADEPTGNLDSKSGGRILTLFEELLDEGRTVILVTHDEAIARLARRVIRLFDGTVVADDPGIGAPDVRS